VRIHEPATGAPPEACRELIDVGIEEVPSQLGLARRRQARRVVTRQHREQRPGGPWGERAPHRLRQPLEATDLGHGNEPATRPTMRTDLARTKQTPQLVRRTVQLLRGNIGRHAVPQVLHRSRLPVGCLNSTVDVSIHATGWPGGRCRTSATTATTRRASPRRHLPGSGPGTPARRRLSRSHGRSPVGGTARRGRLRAPRATAVPRAQGGAGARALTRSARDPARRR
jgi:hypothetical protein